MANRKKIIKNLFLIVLTGMSLSCFAQVTISGPVCVVPGTVYEYRITGSWDSVSTMQACVTGGVIPDSLASNCTAQGAPLAAILVIWENNITSGLITVTSSAGNSSLSVSITTPLIPGSIDSLSRQQAIGYDSIPSTIFCTADSGGSCSPSYTYCWQQSTDAVNWVNAADSTSQNLNFSSPLTITTFYRRKVTESTSGAIGYSDIAVVNVYPQISATGNPNTPNTIEWAMLWKSSVDNTGVTIRDLFVSPQGYAYSGKRFARQRNQ